MSNEKFKVKFGLAVGDTQATIDGTNGDISTLGDIDVKGGAITNSTGPLSITTASNGDLTLDPQGSGQTVVNSAIDVNGNITGDLLNIDNITIDANTISTTDINGNLLLDPVGTGQVHLVATSTQIGTGAGDAQITTSGAYDMTLSTNNGNNSGTIVIADGVNGDITITPNGNGDVILDSDTVQIEQKLTTNGANNLILNTNNGTNSGSIQITQGASGNIAFTPNGSGVIQVGASNTTATITSNGTGDLLLNTNTGTNSGSITIANGANGNITLAPNGTGDVVLTLANGGNLTNNRNYVFGAIRNATTDSIGDIWAVNTTGTVQPFRGISIDNSADTTKLPGVVIRSYNSTSTNRGRIIFERARGTAASPTAVQSGDFLGEFAVSGCNGAGTWLNDSISAVPGFFGFTAAENWSSNTNLGTNFSLSLAPLATTISTGANLVTCMAIRPETSVLKGDQFAISQAKTSAFTATGCSTSGSTLTIGTVTSGTVAVGQLVQTSTTSFFNATYIISNVSGSGSGSVWNVSSTPGTQTALTVTGQTAFIGSPAAATTVDALQDLRLLKNVIKGSTGTTQVTTSASGTTLALAGNTITFNNASATTYATFNSTSATFTQPIGFPVYTIAGKPATGVVGQQISISDSPTSGGRMAFYDTTNSRWSYISDNSAV